MGVEGDVVEGTLLSKNPSDEIELLVLMAGIIDKYTINCKLYNFGQILIVQSKKLHYY